jgi:hypothetical protein
MLVKSLGAVIVEVLGDPKWTDRFRSKAKEARSRGDEINAERSDALASRNIHTAAGNKRMTEVDKIVYRHYTDENRKRTRGFGPNFGVDRFIKK